MITAVVNALTQGFTGTLTGMGNGVVSVFDSLFVTTDGALTNFAQVGLVMGGISLGIGVFLWLVHKVGGRRKA